jgi:hypothetical protein
MATGNSVSEGAAQRGGGSGTCVPFLGSAACCGRALQSSSARLAERRPWCSRVKRGGKGQGELTCISDIGKRLQRAWMRCRCKPLRHRFRQSLRPAFLRRVNFRQALWARSRRTRRRAARTCEPSRRYSKRQPPHAQCVWARKLTSGSRPRGPRSTGVATIYIDAGESKARC